MLSKNIDDLKIENGFLDFRLVISKKAFRILRSYMKFELKVPKPVMNRFDESDLKLENRKIICLGWNGFYLKSTINMDSFVDSLVNALIHLEQLNFSYRFFVVDINNNFQGIYNNSLIDKTYLPFPSLIFNDLEMEEILNK